jgi:N-terminal domain of anti-restriction factor ArdC
MAQNFAAPIWMTFKQASELDAHIRKGEKGSLVVYADSITRKETDEKTGDEIDREIPFLNQAARPATRLCPLDVCMSNVRIKGSAARRYRSDSARFLYCSR